MKRTTPILSLLLLVSPVFVQDLKNVDIPSEKQVREFLDLMQVKPMMVQMVEGMKQAQKRGAEEAFKRIIPDAKPEQLQRASSIADDVFRNFPIDEMINATIPIYQRHLTTGDLDAIISFYKSVAGQKLLKERPAMMAEGMQAGQDIMLKRLPDILEHIKTRVTELAQEELKADKEHHKADLVRN